MKGLTYLCGLLNECDFPYALLKGAKLQEIYPCGTRTSNDIDILINRVDLAKLCKLLYDNGFNQGFIRNGQFQEANRLEVINALINRGETIPFIKCVDYDDMKYLEVDINFSIDETNHENEMITYQMLQRSEYGISTNKGKLYTLEKVDFFIHLCTHLYKEATNLYWVQVKRDLKLYKFLDIYLFCSNKINEDEWKILEQRMVIYGVEDAVKFSIYCTNLIWFINNEKAQAFIEKYKNERIERLNLIYDQSANEYYKYNDSIEERIFDEQHLLKIKKIKKI